MSAPKVTAVVEASPAGRAGIQIGDELLELNGQHPRDVIEYQRIVDAPFVELVVRRGTRLLPEPVSIEKDAGEPLGLQVASALFDRIRTCDNHCAFCFIYQLPKGMRRSLYVKDDDYRLSFLYGNFTTLTRFTELDAERVLEEHLSPLFVSIHATDPDVRSSMLRNPKGATSLRWLRVLLEGGIEIHGQVVVCPGVNDGAVLTDTFAGVLDEYPKLASLGVVPLGVSDDSHEADMRFHTVAEAEAVCDVVATWQEVYRSVLGRRLVHAADEYYLLTGRSFPETDIYDEFPQLENGIGMARSFESAFRTGGNPGSGTRHGFFAAVDGAPAAGYRAVRVDGATTAPVTLRARDRRPITVLTGRYGQRVLQPLLDEHPRKDLEIMAIDNVFFGGNIAVAGLLTGTDVSEVLRTATRDRRYLLPDACLSEGVFLDGMRLEELPVPVEAIPADGAALRAVLDGRTVQRQGCS